MARYARSLKTIYREQASMDNAAFESVVEEVKQEFGLTALERRLLGEALVLLADTRTRALQLTTEFSRRQGRAAPDVHDFQLPAIIDLQRRFCGQQQPLIE